jgi:enoyl-CoA hydratase/carnithine racemase
VFWLHRTLPASSGAAAELALTARAVPAAEAAQLGLVSRVHGSSSELIAAVMKLAADIAAKSPLAVAGTKAVLLHTR